MTAATLIDGRQYAADLCADLDEEVEECSAAGMRPGLAVVLVGDSYPAHAYERRLRRLADQVNCHYVCEVLPGDAVEAECAGDRGKARG